MTTRNVDLHSHSCFSDGVLSPAEVAERAKKNGVEIWALTDHDEVKGVAEARAAAQACGLHYVPGVEISVSWAGETIHIVGVQIDETNSELLEGLTRTRSGREQRAHEIAAQLAAVGIPDAFQGALKYVGNPDLISRTHFARYIQELGRCVDMSSVFHNYLVEGKPGFVLHRWAQLSDAVRWIRGAGGIAILAHPGRYHYSELAFDTLLDEFKQAGGTGIEVVTGGHTPEQYHYYAQVANQYGLLASRGSDFHGQGESHADLGKLPNLPKQVTPVWHDWL